MHVSVVATQSPQTTTLIGTTRYRLEARPRGGNEPGETGICGERRAI
jgi:hypothetical protein